MSQSTAAASSVSVEQIQARAEAFRRDDASVRAEIGKVIVGHGRAS